VIYAFIETQKAELPIAFMCERLGVSRAGFYQWRARRHTPAARTLADRELTVTIRQIHRQSRGIYGAPRQDGLQGVTRRGWTRLHPPGPRRDPVR
jgi:putative transposase